jgi:pantetheine-phosphate adenylyltransferase
LETTVSTSRIAHACVPGTFDQVTYGHLDVIRRSCRLFDRVTVAVAASYGKNGTGPAFSLDERVDMIRGAIAESDIPSDVEVVGFEGLLVDLCHQIGAGAVVKGLRAATDFEYELQQADLNNLMAPDIESVYVMGSREYGYISSSIVRELAALGRDVSFLVPLSIDKRLKDRFGRS